VDSSDYSVRISGATVNEAVRMLLGGLLSTGIVKSALVPQRLAGGGVGPTLVSGPGSLGALDVETPVIMVSAARLASNLSFRKPRGMVGIVARPCEYRALVELAKLKQADREALLSVTVDCLGTVEPRELAAAGGGGATRCDGASGATSGGGAVGGAGELLRRGEGPGGAREACLTCVHPEATGSDLHVCVIGVGGDDAGGGGAAGGGVIVRAQTPVGRAALERVTADGAASDVATGQAAACGAFAQAPAPVVLGRRAALLESLGATRARAREAAQAAFEERVPDLTALSAALAGCIRCTNCRQACPICYCRECVFETQTFEHHPDDYLRWAERKGVIQMPADRLLFHLTRLNHMSLSCVGCGLCESACPNHLPISRLFQVVGRRADRLFDYEPGRRADEPLPLTTFKEVELEPR
jgi:formate dehydrogenase subunit beta